MVYVYNEILFSFKKEENFDPCLNMNKTWGHYARWNKPVTKRTNIIWVYLCEVPRRVKFIETESMNGGFQEMGV